MQHNMAGYLYNSLVFHIDKKYNIIYKDFPRKNLNNQQKKSLHDNNLTYVTAHDHQFKMPSPMLNPVVNQIV